MSERIKCNICESNNIKRHDFCKNPILIDEINANSVRVTNKDYGLCLEMVKCLECGLVQPRYELDFSDVVKLYSDMDDDEYIKSSHLRGLSNYNQIIKILKKHLNKSSRILEIGSGSGVLVGLLKEDFSNVDGIEPSRYFCDYAKEKYDVDMKNISFEMLDGSKKYDAVVALDVIEHVTSPNDFMKVVGDILNDEGITIIVTPNKDSISAKIMGKKWWHIRPPHLFYFDDKSFNVLAKKYNFNFISKKLFYWNLPFYYLIDSLQKLFIGQSLVSFKFLSFNVKINMLDSRLYVLIKNKK